MSHRPKQFDEDSDARPKRVRPQNLLSPGFLDSDLPSQLGLIRVREDIAQTNVYHAGFAQPTARIGERQFKSIEAEDMDIEHSG
jgi:hypothetical protein